VPILQRHIKNVIFKYPQVIIPWDLATLFDECKPKKRKKLFRSAKVLSSDFSHFKRKPSMNWHRESEQPTRLNCGPRIECSDSVVNFASACAPAKCPAFRQRAGPGGHMHRCSSGIAFLSHDTCPFGPACRCATVWVA